MKNNLLFDFKIHGTESEMDPEPDSENNSRLHILRLQLLERLIEYLPKLSNVGGVRVIPFFQVLTFQTVQVVGVYLLFFLLQ